MTGAISVLAMIGMGVGVWGFICNERTHFDRRWLINRAFSAPNWRVRQAAFSRVSYPQHMWHRFFLLDSYSLYDPVIWGGGSRAAAFEKMDPVERAAVLRGDREEDA